MLRRTLLAASLFALCLPCALASSATEIPAPDGASAEPFLAASRDGLMMSWFEPVAGTKDHALRFATLRQGKWSPPRTIARRADFFVNGADFPSVVEDARGVLFAHWLQKSASSTYAYDVRIAISKDHGATWSSPLLLNRDGKAAEHGFASLSPLPKGGVAVAWLDGRNMVEGKEEGDMSLRFATVDAAGAVHDEIQLDGRTCECCTTAMTLVDGQPVVFYRDRSAEEVRDVAVTRRTAKGWTAPAALHEDGWEIAGCPVNGPQADSRGDRVAAAWFTGAGDHARTYLSFSENGGASFGAPVTIDDGRPVGRVDVVMPDASSAIVTWFEQSGGGVELRARRVTAKGEKGPSLKVATIASARGAGFARAAIVGSEVYVAWTELLPSAKRVHVARLKF